MGFRPFVYKIAIHNGLTGFVQNTPKGVQIEIQGIRASHDKIIRILGIKDIADYDIQICILSMMEIIQGTQLRQLEGIPEIRDIAGF